jgi:thioredoxin 1
VDVVTQESFGADVVDASRAQPVLVDIWGPQCAPCLAMMPFVEQLAESQRDALRVVKLNSADARRLCFELRVMGLPTFLLYQDGQEVWRLSGDAATPAGVRGKLGLT